MLKVGLTGGIGSGKTTVAEIFVNLGVPVFFADTEARNIMESSEEVVRLIKGNFGEESYEKEKLNRKFLAEIVFSDPEKLKKLNSIVHPAVHRQFEHWQAEHLNHDYIIEEAALLCESGAYKNFDYLVLITAPLNKKIERVMIRDGVSELEVKKRIESQMTEDMKIIHSHFLIFNDDENMVLNQAMAFHNKMISLNNKLN